jgi:hypothetical protein
MKGWSAVAAFLAESLLVAAIYWPTRRLAFASDAWVYLGALHQGLWTAIGVPIGYHWQPVACLWIAAIRALFGEHPAAFQSVNLVQLVLLGHLTFQLGQRLLADTLAAFLASLLVLGSAAFYEATYWPLAGNMHLLGALLYVLALILAYDWARGGFPRGGGWRLGLTLVAAFLSHPAMVTSIVACALMLLAVGRPTDQRMPEASLARRLKPLLPVAVAAAVFVMFRLRPNPLGFRAPRPGLEPWRLFALVDRGVLAVWTGRASLDLPERILSLGTPVRTPQPEIWFYVGLWITALVLGTAIVLWRVRSRGVRLLVAFMGIHLAALTVAGGISARQNPVPSVFAALITAWALCAGARGVVTAARIPAGMLLSRAVPAVCVALLIAAARADHRTAAGVHLRVAEAIRALIVQLKSMPRPARETDLTVVNLPGAMSQNGITAFALANGNGELTRIVTGGVHYLEWARIPIPSAPPIGIGGVPLMSRTTLREQLSDPRRVVLLFEDDPLRVRRLSPPDMDTLSSR